MKGGWACSGTDQSGQARKASNASEGLTLTRTKERTVLGFTGLPSAYVAMREVDLMIDQISGDPGRSRARVKCWLQSPGVSLTLTRSLRLDLRISGIRWRLVRSTGKCRFGPNGG